MTLPAFAAEHRDAAPLLLRAGQQAMDVSCPPGAQQQTRSSGVRRACDEKYRRRLDRTDSHTAGGGDVGSRQKEAQTVRS